MIVRTLFLLLFAMALLTAFGCSSDNNTPLPPTPAALACTDGGGATANGVSLECGGALSSTTEQVKVQIGGPASGTTTLRGLNFDVTYDATKLNFVPASSYTSSLFPNALVAVTLANGVQGRVVVSIQQAGAFPDVVVNPGQYLVVGLAFQRVAAVNFAPTPLAFQNAEATAASATIGFSSVLALSYQ